jgi:hypothetical protein
MQLPFSSTSVRRCLHSTRRRSVTTGRVLCWLLALAAIAFGARVGGWLRQAGPLDATVFAQGTPCPPIIQPTPTPTPPPGDDPPDDPPETPQDPPDDPPMDTCGGCVCVQTAQTGSGSAKQLPDGSWCQGEVDWDPADEIVIPMSPPECKCDTGFEEQC